MLVVDPQVPSPELRKAAAPDKFVLVLRRRPMFAPVVSLVISELAVRDQLQRKPVRAVVQFHGHGSFPYCLSKTRTLSTGLPFASTPFTLTVMVWPSVATTMCSVASC